MKKAKVRHVICGILAVVMFFFLFGVVGHMEHGYLSFKVGAWLLVGGCSLFACFVFGSGAIGK